MEPSSSIWAPIQVVIEISVFVATSFSCDWSVETSTFCVMGRVVRVATALPTTARPRLRFSCRLDSRIPNTPILSSSSIEGQLRAVKYHGSWQAGWRVQYLGAVGCPIDENSASKNAVVDRQTVTGSIGGVPTEVRQFSRTLRVTLWSEHLALESPVEVDYPLDSATDRPSGWPVCENLTGSGDPYEAGRHHAACHHLRSPRWGFPKWVPN